MMNKLLILLLILLFSQCSPTNQEEKEAQAQSEKPNIIFIICDDLNDIAVDGAGHPQAKMPNVQRLAARGVSFTNAITNAPICAPARASLLAGIYPHHSRYFGFRHKTRYYRASPVLDSAKTFVEYFMENGYDVFGTGKIFHNGAKEWPNGQFGYPQSFSPFPWDGQHKANHGADSLGFMPHPNKPEPLQTNWEGTFGRLSDKPDFPDNEGVAHEGWMSFSKPYRYESADERDPMPDELNAQYAVDVINKSHEKPFFLAVGFTSTHTPYYAPDNYFDRFPLETLEIAKSKPNDLDDCAEILAVEEGTSNTDYGFRRYNEIMQAGGEEMLKKWTQAYLACAALVDDQVGKIMEALENSPHKDNTILIFTSDHGFHMGEKDFLFKNSVWHESLNIPLIFAGPGIAQGEVGHPVSLVDLFPTFIDMAGLPENPNASTNKALLDGHSLRPFLQNPDFKDWNGPDVALSVVQGTEITDMHDAASVFKQHYILHSKDYHYVLCNNGEEELYDIQADPYEWNNLANEPGFIENKAGLKAWIMGQLENNNQEE